MQQMFTQEFINYQKIKNKKTSGLNLDYMKR